MARPKRIRLPVTLHLDRLEAKHTSGRAAGSEQRWMVRGAPVGAVVEAQPGRKGTARRLRVLQPAPDQVDPACPLFGTCGGCQLQEMPLGRQRQEKGDLLHRLVGLTEGDGVLRHPVRGAAGAYHYRNKIELSWGNTRFIPESQLEAFRASGESTAGSHLGFHPPGWFGRIVPVPACPLGTPAMNAAIQRVQALQLAPAWDTVEHRGTWRHLVLRDSGSPEAPRLLVSVVTSSAATRDDLEPVVSALADLPGLTGLLWVVTDSLAEVARGELREVLWGEADLCFDLAGLSLRLPYDAFFQVNTQGAEILVQTVAEALGLTAGRPGGTLLDLYCGVGTFGLALAQGYDQVVGIELHAPAIDDARQNAAANGIAGSWHAGLVEDVLPGLPDSGARAILVDPPRVGLHPRAARFLADQPGDVLVYVACGPASLGRDRAVLEAGGWRLTDLWTVDLFPQTHHIEAVARFQRDPATA